MSEEHAELLNLELAWARVKQDLADEQLFVRLPFERRLIEADTNAWLAALKGDIAHDRYHPGPAVTIDVPKARGAIRPGGHISLRDAVVYYAAVGACLPAIEQALRWAKGIDFAYQLSSKTHRIKWLVNRFKGWTAFRESTLLTIDGGYSYVVICDIAAFYENVDISVLMSDLRTAGCPQAALDILSPCLNRWALVEGRGLTQGHTASAILAKLYLNSLDYNLRELGHTHKRYVDDIRFFCRSLPEARKALVDISQLLRPRGLQLATEKLEIFRADYARRRIAGVVSVIQTVQARLIEQLVGTLGLENPYLEIWEIDKILSDNADEAPLDLIRETYQSYFIDSPTSFDRTLFRFLLRRLASAGDTLAVENCRLQFEQHPEESRAILRYIGDVGAQADFGDFLSAYVASERAVYAYQTYNVINWYLTLAARPPEPILGVARGLAFDENQPEYLRAVTREMIGQHGAPADLERIEAAYNTARGDLEKAEIICAVRRMETGRRNAFLGRVEHDGELQRRAARLVRAGLYSVALRHPTCTYFTARPTYSAAGSPAAGSAFSFVRSSNSSLSSFQRKTSKMSLLALIISVASALTPDEPTTSARR